jgi:hypothetical protein
MDFTSLYSMFTASWMNIVFYVVMLLMLAEATGRSYNCMSLAQIATKSVSYFRRKPRGSNGAFDAVDIEDRNRTRTFIDDKLEAARFRISWYEYAGPSVGFLGTVVGIMTAMPEMRGDIDVFFGAFALTVGTSILGMIIYLVALRGRLTIEQATRHLEAELRTIANKMAYHEE